MKEILQSRQVVRKNEDGRENISMGDDFLIEKIHRNLQLRLMMEWMKWKEKKQSHVKSLHKLLK
jgi:hypothetical protein